MKTSKKSEWLKRYTMPEIAGLVGAYTAVYLYKALSTAPHAVVSSFLGTWGENVGYYYSIFSKDLKFRRLAYPTESLLIRFLKVTRGIFIEFGISETLDSFVVRPLCLYYGMKFFGENLGILIGKFSADIVFYIPTIISYEVKKKYKL